MRTGGRAKVDVMFDASWWHKFYDVAFDEPYVRAHPLHRAQLEGRMRRALFDRFGSVGLGSPTDEPVPIISTRMTPLNYLVGEVLGCSTYFSAGSTPCTIPLRLDEAAIDRFEVNEVMQSPVMRKLAEDMDWLEANFGRVIGDLNPQGVLNNAMCVADSEIFILFMTNPELAKRFLKTITDTMIEVIGYVKGRTGTCAISVTNIVEQIDPAIFCTSNCSTTMISPANYRDFLLECDQRLADTLPPFGIHHCGFDLQKMVPEYKKVDGLKFLEVGWGSDLRFVRSILPDVHLNARYSPVKMRTATPEEIDREVGALIEAGKPLDKLSVSILGLDDFVPDENVIAFFEAADRHWE